jgi:hypothetical protein
MEPTVAVAYVAGVEESRCAVSPGAIFGCGVFCELYCILSDVGERCRYYRVCCRSSSIAGRVYPLLEALCATMCAELGLSVRR